MLMMIRAARPSPPGVYDAQRCAPVPHASCSARAPRRPHVSPTRARRSAGERRRGSGGGGRRGRGGGTRHPTRSAAAPRCTRTRAACRPARRASAPRWTARAVQRGRGAGRARRGLEEGAGAGEAVVEVSHFDDNLADARPEVLRTKGGEARPAVSARCDGAALARPVAPLSGAPRGARSVAPRAGRASSTPMRTLSSSPSTSILRSCT
jgi:hypothetical protein